MKLRSILLCGALSAATLPAADTLTGEFQRALFEEEANRNLPAAIAGYEAVIKRLDEQRQLAATAVFRLGESYRKLGKTNEAVAAYERIIREFADQETLVKLSGQNLSVLRPSRTLAATPETSAPGPATPVDLAELRRLEILLETVRSLEPMSEAELRTLLEFANDENAAAFLQSLRNARRQLGHAEEKLRGQPENRVARSQASQWRSSIVEDEAFLSEWRATTLRMLEARVEAARRLAGRGDAVTGASGGSQTGAQDASLLAAQAEHERLHWAYLQLLNAKSREEKQAAIQMVIPDSTLSRLDEMAVAARVELAGLLSEYGPEHGDVKAARAKLDELNKSIEERVSTLTQATLRRLQSLHPSMSRAVAIPIEQPEAVQSPEKSMTAEEAEELRRVQALAANSPDLLNQRGSGGGLRPIEEAADKGWVQVIDYLLKRGARFDLKTNHGRTPLHIAAEAGHLGVVERLMQRGVDLNAVDNNGRTALFIACEKGFTGVAAVLIRAGADMNLPGKVSRTSRSVLGKPVSPLAVAKAEISRHLLHRGALPDGPPGSEPPIVTAGGDTEKLELLLAHKAKPGVTNSAGETALHYAAQAGNTANVRRLLALGLEPNARGVTGVPVIEHCVQHAFYSGTQSDVLNTYREVLMVLLETGADVNTKLSSVFGGVHLLHVASRFGDLQAMKYLIEKGADVNARAEDGHTPLHVAAAQNQAEAIRLLVEHKAKVNLADHQGDTPLHFAAMAQALEAAQALVEAGADQEMENGNGHKPRAFVQRTNVSGHEPSGIPMTTLGIPGHPRSLRMLRPTGQQLQTGGNFGRPTQPDQPVDNPLLELLAPRSEP